MTTASGPSPVLSACGCCEGTRPSTPARVVNRPGLSAIAYRTGTWHEFKRSLLAGLAAGEHPELAGLTTRDDDDFTIALLDAVASVADVLTFYGERIANEAYLRTATERLSVVELARQIGYEAGPGVAASTLLAFTVEDPPGGATAADAPTTVAVGIGVKAQSIPGHGEKPQTFETVEALEARVPWNAMRLRRTGPQALAIPGSSLWLSGTATGLRVGDWLLLVGGGLWEACRVTAVTADLDARSPVTHVAVQSMGSNAPASPFVPGGGTRGIAASDATVVPATSPGRFARVRRRSSVAWPVTPTVIALRTRAGIFGQNAAEWRAMSLDFQKHYQGSESPGSEWPGFESIYRAGPTGDGATIDLDAVYASILPGDWLVLATSGAVAPFRVTRSDTVGRAAFGLGGKATEVTLSGSGFDAFTSEVRDTAVHAGSDVLGLAASPIDPPVTGFATALALDADCGDMPRGRRLLVAGVDAVSGLIAVEPVTLDHVATAGGASTLVLGTALTRSYLLESATVFGNVSLATHGESVDEVLGGGDASRPYQRFGLRQPPLTFVRDDAAPSGAASTLAVRVDGLLWQEVPSFHGRGPQDHVFATRTSDDGATTVRFGDGVHGARLPSGQENVRAHYRKGVGTAGNVRAGHLTMLLTKPLGLKAVTNPRPADGGDDPEPRDAARDNAPLTVLTLDRVVSLRDYEDFSRAYAGVAKSLATWSWDGERRGVFITVAGPGGVPVVADVLDRLTGAIRAAGDPFVPLRIATFRPAAFTLSFRTVVDAAYARDAVSAEVVARLRAGFGFASRAFGQPVALSDVIAAIQGTPGVTAVDVDALARTDGVGGSGLDAPLPAAWPEAVSLGATLAAELLTLADDPVLVGAMR